MKMMETGILEEITRWISLGWEYQIIHKLTLRKHNYELTKEEFRSIKDNLAMKHAQIM